MMRGASNMVPSAARPATHNAVSILIATAPLNHNRGDQWSSRHGAWVLVVFAAARLGVSGVIEWSG